jgi:hypothetical protein
MPSSIFQRDHLVLMMRVARFGITAVVIARLWPVQGARVAIHQPPLYPSRHGAADAREHAYWLEECVDGEGDPAEVIALHEEEFFAGYWVPGKCAVGESNPVRLIDHVDHAARYANTERSDAETHEDDSTWFSALR